jgi:type I restriction enzyme S subunit
MATEEDYIKLLRDLILNRIDKEKYAVFIFGGRARGRTGKAVDIDIGLLGNAPMGIDRLAELYNAIEESSIPYKVDLVDFYVVDPQFRNIALSDILIWNQPPTIKIN